MSDITITVRTAQDAIPVMVTAGRDGSSSGIFVEAQGKIVYVTASELFWLTQGTHEIFRLTRKTEAEKLADLAGRNRTDYRRSQNA